MSAASGHGMPRMNEDPLGGNPRLGFSRAVHRVPPSRLDRKKLKKVARILETIAIFFGALDFGNHREVRSTSRYGNSPLRGTTSE